MASNTVLFTTYKNNFYIKISHLIYCITFVVINCEIYIIFFLL